MIIWINNNKFCDALHRVRWLRAKAEYTGMKRAPEWQLATGNTFNIIHTRFIMWWIHGVAALHCRLPVLRSSRSVSYLIPCILLTISSRLIFLFSSVGRSVGRSCWLCGALVVLESTMRETRSRARRVLDAFSHIMWQLYGEGRPYNIRDTLMYAH